MNDADRRLFVGLCKAEDESAAGLADAHVECALFLGRVSPAEAESKRAEIRALLHKTLQDWGLV
jgi:hypothetical protein